MIWVIDAPAFEVEDAAVPGRIWLVSESDLVGSELHVYGGLGQADVSKGQPQWGKFGNAGRYDTPMCGASDELVSQSVMWTSI